MAAGIGSGQPVVVYRRWWRRWLLFVIRFFLIDEVHIFYLFQIGSVRREIIRVWEKKCSEKRKVKGRRMVASGV